MKDLISASLFGLSLSPLVFAICGKLYGKTRALRVLTHRFLLLLL